MKHHPADQHLVNTVYQFVKQHPGKTRNELLFELVHGNRRVKRGTAQCYLDKLRKAGYITVQGVSYSVTNPLIESVNHSDLKKPNPARSNNMMQPTQPYGAQPFNNKQTDQTQTTKPTEPPKEAIIETASKACEAQESRVIKVQATYKFVFGDQTFELNHSEVRMLKKQLDSIIGV